MTPNPLPPELERLARKRVKAKSGFFMHAVIYLVVNTGLTVLALSKGQSWSIWPAAGWGFGLLMHGATQVVSLLAWSSLPFSERFQRLLSIAHGAAAVMVPALAPVFYMRWRPHLLLTYRVTFFAFPLLRRPRGGWECQLPCFAAACGPATLSFSWRCARWVSVTPAATPHSIPACTSCLA
jgi:hypothetical protein